MATSNGSRGTVLLVGFDDAGAESLIEVLRRHRFVASAVTLVAALEEATATAVAAVVANYPLASESPQGFLSTLRHLTSASRRAAFVFVVTGAVKGDAEAFIGRGANRVVAREDAPRILPGVLERLLQVAPRVAVKGVSRLDLASQALAHRVLCQTVNVSATGMLVRLPKVLPLGSEVRFELLLRPDFLPVSGRSRVVRHASERRERYSGVGLNFLEFHGDGQGRLQEQLLRLAG